MDTMETITTSTTGAVQQHMVKVISILEALRNAVVPTQDGTSYQGGKRHQGIIMGSAGAIAVDNIMGSIILPLHKMGRTRHRLPWPSSHSMGMQG